MGFLGVLGEIVATNADLPELALAFNLDFNAGAGRTGVARQPPQTNPEVAGLLQALLAQAIGVEARGPVLVLYGQVHIAIAIVVQAADCPTLPTVSHSQCSSALGKVAVTVGQEQSCGGVLELQYKLPPYRGVVVAIAVHMKQVEVAIVIEIREAASPTPAAVPQPGLVGGIFEGPITPVTVQPVAGDAPAVDPLGAGPAARIVDGADKPVDVAIIDKSTCSFV